MMRSRLFRVLLVLVGLAVAVLGGAFLTARPAPAHRFFDRLTHRPLVIAHADDTGRGLWPGNTMAHLEGAAALGVDVLEVDAHMTRDGVLVLMHDETVDRTTNGTGRIRDLTLAELGALEVAYHWTQGTQGTQDGAGYPYRGRGLRVPTLEEAFRRFPRYPMVVEIKQAAPSMAEPLCRMIRAHGKEETVLVASFSDQAMDEFRSACPAVATSAAPDEIRRFVALDKAWLGGTVSPDYLAFQVPVAYGDITIVTPAFVAAARQRSVQVHVWTVNEPEVMQRLLDMGVDGILTDRPDILMRLVGRQAAAAPAGATPGAAPGAAPGAPAGAAPEATTDHEASGRK